MKNKKIRIIILMITISVFGATYAQDRIVYAQDKTKSPPSKSLPAPVSATDIAIQEGITPMFYKSINEVTSLKPNQVGIDKKNFYQQAQSIRRSVYPNPSDSPEVQKAKNTKLGLLEFQGSPTMTFFRLEDPTMSPITPETPGGAVGIESAIFPQGRNASGKSWEEVKAKQKLLDEERRKNRKILWRWDVPKEFVNGTLTGTASGVAFTRSTDPRERFSPVLLSAISTEFASKRICTLYGFDSIKGKLWERDMLPLIDKNMYISGMGSVSDGSSTIVVASSSQEEAEKGTGGIRIIMLDAKGKITSMSDIKGVSAGQFYRNESLNSFRLGGFIMSIEGKKYEPRIQNNFSFDLFITKKGVISRLVDEKGETIRGGVGICVDDKLAYSADAGIAWDLSAVFSR